MRLVLQRVSSASVTIKGLVHGEIGCGLLALIGVESGDSETDLVYLAEKTLGLRIFNDDEGKFNRSLSDIDGEILVVSQFTLLGDSRKGRRPSFTQSAPPDAAKMLYEQFVEAMRNAKVKKVATGEFGANMQVSLVNDGPVTILLDSRKVF